MGSKIKKENKREREKKETKRGRKTERQTSRNKSGWKLSKVIFGGSNVLATFGNFLEILGT